VERPAFKWLDMAMGACAQDHMIGMRRTTARIVSDLVELEELAPAWDTLAISAGRPRSLSAFLVAWYRHCLPPGGLIRVIVVADGNDVIGVAPFYATRTRLGFSEYRMSTPTLWGCEPLCAAGYEESVGEALGRVLEGAEPTPDVVYMDSLPGGSSWPERIRSAWSRPKPAVRKTRSSPWPRIQLGPDGFEGWLATRSKNFRKQFRSDFRKLKEEGFEHRILTSETDIVSRLGDFGRMYEARRARRDGAGPPFDEQFAALVKEVAHKVDDTGQLWMSTIERPGEVIEAGLGMCAGAGLSLWYGGFDDGWARLSPSKWSVVWSIEYAARRGVTDVDFGAGVYDWKGSFTDEAPEFESFVIVRRGLRPFHTPAQLLPFRLRRDGRRAARRALPLVRGRRD
jgi:CelD/BcsL family acetyltransferase involved in cellulose biosynthesis